MSNEITTTVKVLHRKDGLINLYLYHPYDNWQSAKTARTVNKNFINWIRKSFPKVLNEFREMPTSYENYYGHITSGYRQHHFCAYGLSKVDYMRIKLSWVMSSEIQLHTKKRSYAATGSKGGRTIALNVPGKKYFDLRYTTPTEECVTRFENPKFKQKYLKV